MAFRYNCKTERQVDNEIKDISTKINIEELLMQFNESAERDVYSSICFLIN